MENGDIWGTDSIMSDINTHPASIHRSDFCPLVPAKLTLPLWVLTMLMPRGLCCMLLCRWSMEPWLADIVMLLSWAVGRRDQIKINSTKCFRILLYQRRCFFFLFILMEIQRVNCNFFWDDVNIWREHHIIFYLWCSTSSLHLNFGQFADFCAVLLSL